MSRYRYLVAALACLALGCAERSPEGAPSDAAPAPELVARSSGGEEGEPHPEDRAPYLLEPAFPHLSFERPVCLVQADDGTRRWLLVEQVGRLRVFDDDPAVTSSRVVLDLGDRTLLESIEEGFLSVALHPRFRDNGLLYVYVSVDAPRRNQLLELRLPPGPEAVVDPASERLLLELHQPWPTHNGGALLFGPDGYLYLSVGDGGAANDPDNNGQDLSTLLGSILRLDVDGRDGDLPYAIPPENPFVGVAGARPEIYAYGLRNVWRMSFDRATGRLWAGDVGQTSWEEVDHVVAGGNYGWKLREGRHAHGVSRSAEEKVLIDPIWEYSHEEGAAIIGGYVYRGARLSELEGWYLFADYAFGTVWGLRWDGEEVAEHRVLARPPRTATTFAESLDGELYVLSMGGTIYRLVANPSWPSG